MSTLNEHCRSIFFYINIYIFFNAPLMFRCGECICLYKTYRYIISSEFYKSLNVFVHFLFLILYIRTWIIFVTCSRSCTHMLVVIFFLYSEFLSRNSCYYMALRLKSLKWSTTADAEKMFEFKNEFITILQW
jgi:hypothetical protein